MDISVIIPCHNLEKYITPMLVSLRLQELDEALVELIFVCDRCTDKTRELIEAFNFGPQYQKVSIFDADCGACGLARNIGLEKAEGDIIIFLDGDDYLTSNVVFYKILGIFKRYDIPLLRFDYESTFPQHSNPAMVWQYAYKRELIGDVRFPDIQPHEDLIFNRIIAKKVGGIENIPYITEVFYHYNYLREGSNISQLVTKGVIE